jgi:hypothetical protein
VRVDTRELPISQSMISWNKFSVGTKWEVAAVFRLRRYPGELIESEEITKRKTVHVSGLWLIFKLVSPLPV